MTEAGFGSVGYDLVIEDKTIQKLQSKRKTFVPLVVISKSSRLRNSSEFVALYIALLRLAQNFWEATTSRIVLTDNKSVKCFFQTKTISPTSWKACEDVLKSEFKIAHNAGSVNTAADFLSRVKIKVTQRIRLKIQEDIPTTPLEATAASSEVVDEE